MPAKDDFNEMRLRIQEYGGKWRGFFQGMSKAYTSAYLSQEKMLKSVQKAQKADTRAEDAKLFGLSLLTTLVAGPFANQFGFATEISPLRKQIEGELNPLTGLSKLGASTVQDLIIRDWVDSLKGVVKKSEPSVDPYVPVGVTPGEYAAELMQGSEERTNLMADVARDWADRAHEYTDAQAAQMRKDMMKSRFFTDAPASAMNSGTKQVLMRKAELSLWVSWAWERDKSHWQGVNVGEDTPWGSSENVGAWEPVRQQLIAVGVPAFVVTRYRQRDFRQTPILDMPAFIEWSFSQHPQALLAAGLPSDPQAVEQVRQQWMLRLLAHQ